MFNVSRKLILLGWLIALVPTKAGHCASEQSTETQPLLQNGDFEAGFVEDIPKGWEFLGSGQIFPGSKQYLCVEQEGQKTVPGSPEYVVHHGSFAPFDGALVQVVDTIPNARYRLSAYVNCRYAKDPKSLCEKEVAPETAFWDYWVRLGYDPTGQVESFDESRVQYPCPNIYYCNPGTIFSSWTTITKTFVATSSKTSIFLCSGMKWSRVAMTCWNDVELEIVTPAEGQALHLSRVLERLHRESEILFDSAYGVGEGFLIRPQDAQAILEYEGIGIPEEAKNGLIVCNPLGKIDLVAVIPTRVAPGRWSRVAGRILTCPLFPRGNKDIAEGLFEVEYTLGPEPRFPGDCGNRERLFVPAWPTIEREFVGPATPPCLIMKIQAPAVPRNGLVIKDLGCTPVLAEVPDIPEQTVITPISDGTGELNHWHYTGSGGLHVPDPSKAFCAGSDCIAPLTSDPDAPFLERIGGYSPFDGAGIFAVLTQPGTLYRVSFPYMFLRTEDSDDLPSLCDHRAVDKNLLVALGTDTSGQIHDFRSSAIKYKLLTRGKSTCKPYDFEGEFIAEGIRTIIYLRVRQEDGGIGGVRVGDVKIEKANPHEEPDLGPLSLSKALAPRCRSIRTAGVLPPRWEKLLKGIAPLPSPSPSGEDRWDGEAFQFSNTEPGYYDLIVPHLPRVRIQREKLPPLIIVEKDVSGEVDVARGELGFPILRGFDLKYPCRVGIDVSGLPAGKTRATIFARCLGDRFSEMAGRLSFTYGDTEKDYFLSPKSQWHLCRFTFDRLKEPSEILWITTAASGEKPSVTDLALPVSFTTTANGEEFFTYVGLPEGPEVPLPIHVRSGAELAGTPVYDPMLSSTIARIHVPEQGDVSLAVSEYLTQETPAALFMPADGTGEVSVPGPSDEFKEVFGLEVSGDFSMATQYIPFPPEWYPFSTEEPEYRSATLAARDSELSHYLLGAYIYGPRWAARTLEDMLAVGQTMVERNPGNWLTPLLPSTENYAIRLRFLHALLGTGSNQKMAQSLCEWHVGQMISTGLDPEGERFDQLLAEFPEGTYVHDYLSFERAQNLIRGQNEQKAVEVLSQITHPELESRKQAALGLAYLGLGDMEAASKSLQQVDLNLVSAAEAEQVLMGSASIHIMEGEYEAALEQLQQILLMSTDASVVEAAQKLLDQIGTWR